MMIIVWVLIILMIYYMVRNNEPVSAKTGYGRTPDEVLKERYARGEIDEATFERMRNLIKR